MHPSMLTLESEFSFALKHRTYNPEVGRFISVDPFEGNVQNPISLHKYIYGNDNPINNIDPSGRMSIGMSLGIGVGLLAGITLGSFLGIIPVPGSRPGFAESLVPFWGSGKAFLYDLHNGNYWSATANAAFFVTDMFFVRSVAAGIAQTGWKKVLTPGTAKIMIGEWLDEGIHAVWQIGDRFFHATGRPSGNWAVRVFKQPLQVEGRAAGGLFLEFSQKFGFPVPVLSSGLAQLATREADCITAMLRAIHRANLSPLERVFKAAVIQAFGQNAIPQDAPKGDGN